MDTPLEPEMVKVAQELAALVNTAQIETDRRRLLLASYIDTCARALGLNPEEVVFDGPNAKFTPKP
jgi:hypothetical protein